MHVDRGELSCNFDRNMSLNLAEVHATQVEFLGD